MYKNLLIVLVSISALMAEEATYIDRFEFSIASDENNQKISPSFYLPLYYSSNMYSAIGSVSKSSYNELKINNADLTQKTSNSTSLDKVWIDIFNYRFLEEDYSYTLGLSLNYEQIEVLQYGYAEFSFNDEWVSTNAKTNIDYYNLGLYADYTQNSIADFFSFRLGTYIYPLTYSKTHETKDFYPIIKNEGSITSSSFQDFRYRFFLSTQFDISSYLSILADIDYEYIPSDTKALGIEQQGFGLGFFESNLIYNSATTVSRLLFLFPSIAIYTINPSVGVGYRAVDVETVYTDAQHTQTSTNSIFYTIGFNKAF